MSRPAVLCAVLVLCAGCSFAPGGTPSPSTQPAPDVEVTFTNSANSTGATYDVEVLLLPRPADRARVTYSDGAAEEVSNLSAVDGVGLYGPTDRAATGVEPVDVEPLDTRTYLGVGPRSSVSSTFEDPPRGAALFVVVTGTDVVSLWATGTCGDDDLNAFGIEIRDVGPGVSIGCESSASATR